MKEKRDIIYELERLVYLESRPDSNAGKTRFRNVPKKRSVDKERVLRSQSSPSSDEPMIIDQPCCSQNSETKKTNGAEQQKI